MAVFEKGCPRLLALLALVIPGVASAYIPPSQYIIRTMSTRHGGFHSIRVKSTVTAFEGDKPSPTHFTSVTLYSAGGDTIRSWALNDSGTPLYGVERRGNTIGPVNAVLFSGSSGELIRTLRDKGIPIRTEDELRGMKDEDERRAAEVEELARWNGVVCWVIGKKAGNGHDNGPQLWVEKDTFEPVRLLFAGDDGQAMRDVRFDQTKSYRGFPYPRAIELHGAGDVTVLREEAVEVVPNGGKKGSRAAEESNETPPSGFTEAGNVAPSELRDLIRQYYTAIR